MKKRMDLPQENTFIFFNHKGTSEEILITFFLSLGGWGCLHIYSFKLEPDRCLQMLNTIILKTDHSSELSSITEVLQADTDYFNYNISCNDIYSYWDSKYSTSASNCSIKLQTKIVGLIQWPSLYLPSAFSLSTLLQHLIQPFSFFLPCWLICFPHLFLKTLISSIYQSYTHTHTPSFLVFSILQKPLLSILGVLNFTS